MITRIENGKVWTEGKLRALSLVLNGEKIHSIAEPNEAVQVPAERVIDASGMWILPGGIDFHVHISEGAETFYPGSCCAASGGITTVCDMAPFHACITEEQMQEKAKVGEAACVIDFGLIAGIVIENDDLLNLQGLASSGAAYFKVFQPAEPPVSHETLWKSVQAAAQSGLRLGLHAEDPIFFRSTVDADDPLSFPQSRPAIAETSVVADVIEMARFTGAPIHICHVSTARTAELVAWGKSHGVDVTCEVPPHFLLLDESAFIKYGARVKTTPPLRSQNDREQLWQALAEGVIDVIACDHYTESLEPLSTKPQAIPDAAAGIASLELSLPLIMDAVLEDNFSLKRFVVATAVRPAELAGISHRKGQLLPGMDADLAFWNPNKNRTAAGQGDFSRIDTTPYNGWNLKGCVSQTWVRGKPVWENDKIQAETGYGRWARSSGKKDNLHL